MKTFKTERHKISKEIIKSPKNKAKDMKIERNSASRANPPKPQPLGTKRMSSSKILLPNLENPISNSDSLNIADHKSIDGQKKILPIRITRKSSSKMKTFRSKPCSSGKGPVDVVQATDLKPITMNGDLLENADCKPICEQKEVVESRKISSKSKSLQANKKLTANKKPVGVIRQADIKHIPLKDDYLQIMDLKLCDGQKKVSKVSSSKNLSSKIKSVKTMKMPSSEGLVGSPSLADQKNFIPEENSLNNSEHGQPKISKVSSSKNLSSKIKSVQTMKMSSNKGSVGLLLLPDHKNFMPEEYSLNNSEHKPCNGQQKISKVSSSKNLASKIKAVQTMKTSSCESSVGVSLLPDQKNFIPGENSLNKGEHKPCDAQQKGSKIASSSNIRSNIKFLQTKIASPTNLSFEKAYLLDLENYISKVDSLENVDQKVFNEEADIPEIPNFGNNSSKPESLQTEDISRNRVPVIKAPLLSLKCNMSETDSDEYTDHQSECMHSKIIQLKPLKVLQTKKISASVSQNISKKPRPICPKYDLRNVTSKVCSLDNANHKPGGGQVKIFSEKLNFNKKARSKVGSRTNLDFVSGSGKLKLNYSSKYRRW